MSRKRKMFIAGPYNFPEEGEVEKMRTLGELMRNRGFEVYMACELKEEDHVERFKKDLEELESSDVVVAQFERYTFGTLFECGYAYAKGKPVYVLSSIRELEDHPFILGGCQLLKSVDLLVEAVAPYCVE